MDCETIRCRHATSFPSALKPALRPVASIYGLIVGSLLSGSFVVEVITAWPGLGSLFTEALARRDYTILMALLMLTSSAVVVLNLVADAAYAFLDPRVRYG